MTIIKMNAYTLSSTKLELRAEQFLPGIEEVSGEGGLRERRMGAGGRNDPSIV
jgi:hypothetical protein